jgi:hypothetical protein
MGYARIPNGTGDFIIKDPTFDQNNENVLGVSSLETELSFNYYPNPTNGILTIDNTEGRITAIKVNSIVGQLLFNKKYNGTSLIQVDFSAFANGTYFATINDSKVIKIIKK